MGRPASNGILHVVSDLVYPPLEYTIAENLKLDPRFSALKMAVEAAGLMDTVENDGPFTLFAPIDEAFDKLAGKTLGKKEATQIVNKHLVKGTIYSLGLIGHTYETLSGRQSTRRRTRKRTTSSQRETTPPLLRN